MKLFKSITQSLLTILFFFIVNIIIYLLVLVTVVPNMLYYAGLITIIFMLLSSYLGIAVGYKLFPNKMNKFLPQTLYTAAFAATLLVYSFHITFPTIIDRSISLFVLSRINGNKDGISIEQVQDSFITGCVHKNSAVCRRLDEQIISGNIVFENQKYYITNRGKNILSILRTFAWLVNQNEYYVLDSPSVNLPYTYTVTNGKCFASKYGSHNLP